MRTCFVDIPERLPTLIDIFWRKPFEKPHYFPLRVLLLSGRIRGQLRLQQSRIKKRKTDLLDT
jgi:hypothetical protein